MRIKNLINKLVFCFLITGFGGNAQISVYKINDLINRINIKSDTIYVVNFWATWCKPCVEELPEFEKLERQNKTQLVKILLVSLDFKENLKKSVIAFIKKNAYSMECVLLDEIDGNSFINKIHLEWSGAIPATLFKNREKIIFREKKLHLNELNEILKEFN